MGDAADLILDGVLCQSCGGIVDRQRAGEGRPEPAGFPRDCDDCRREKNKERGIAQPNPIGAKKARILRALRDGDKPWASFGSHREGLMFMGYVRRDGENAQITNAGLVVLERYENAKRSGAERRTAAPPRDEREDDPEQGRT